MGGLHEYRTIAVVTLYALSIMARYMPGAWHRIEGGDQDHYLALVQESLAVWERLLPEHFLESIEGEPRGFNGVELHSYYASANGAWNKLRSNTPRTASPVSLPGVMDPEWIDRLGEG